MQYDIISKTNCRPERKGVTDTQTDGPDEQGWRETGKKMGKSENEKDEIEQQREE